MSIVAYAGLPGHGKSYGVVENVIVPALKSKRQVFSNIPMNDNICLDRYQMTTTFFDMKDIIENVNWFTEVFVAGSLIVLDELWRLWPAGIKANNVLEQHKSFLAEHRHMVGLDGRATEIYFVTQDLSQISAFARALIENTFLVSKLSALGMTKSYRVDVFLGAVTGCSPPVSKRQQEIFGKYKKEIFEVYKSHTKSETGEAGNEERTDKRFNVLSGYKPKLFIVVFIAAGAAAFMGLNHLLSTGLGGGKNEKKLMNDTAEVKTIESIRKQVAKENAAKINTKKQQYIKKQKHDLLYKSNRVIVAFNMGVFPDIQYLFEVVFSDTKIEMTRESLEKLGYQIQPINSCLVLIENEVYSTYAKCSPNIKKTNFFTDLASSD